MFKIAYCTNGRNYNTWMNTAETQLENVKDWTVWDSEEDKYTNLIKLLKEKLQDIYHVSIKKYKCDCKKYPESCQVTF